MLSLFLDDSGTHAGSSVMALGGFVAREEKWRVFEQEWALALQDYGLDWFHMTDFENRRGRFESWPENKRIPRLNRLLTIANRAAGASVGMSVDVEAFNSLVPDDLKARIGGCYGLNVRAALAQIKRFAKDLGWDEPIEVVFDWRQGSGVIEQDVHRAIRENDDDGKYISVNWERQNHRPPLQAADIVVYNMWKELTRIMGFSDRPQRTKILNRISEKHRNWGYMDEEEIDRFVKKNMHLVS